MAQWHNKHVSTQWGIAILGFFVIATALLVAYLNQSQTIQSSAQGIEGIANRSNNGHHPYPTPTYDPIPRN